jgi:hypothetical protein
VDQLPTRLHPMLWIRFWILNDFFYLETDVIVPTACTGNKQQKNFKKPNFLLASRKSLAKSAGSEAGPDP